MEKFFLVQFDLCMISWSLRSYEYFDSIHNEWFGTRLHSAHNSSVELNVLLAANIGTCLIIRCWASVRIHLRCRSHSLPAMNPAKSSRNLQTVICAQQFYFDPSNRQQMNAQKLAKTCEKLNEKKNQTVKVGIIIGCNKNGKSFVSFFIR